MFNKINRLSIKVFSGCNFNCSFCHQLLDDKHKPFELSDFNNLERFIKSLPFDDIVDVTITGGEITLREDLLIKTYKVLKRVERSIETRFDICIITNGSNMDKIYKWINNGIICPNKTTISWDGIHNSLSRQSFVKDEYFLDEIKKLGQSIYNERISIVHSINPDTIDYLYDSFKYCYDNGVYNIGYYFIHEANYTNIVKKFEEQIEKIAQLVVENIKKHNPIHYYNWQNIYTTRMDNKNFFLCNKLGNNYHIDMFGNVYPCIYFGDHRTLKIGNIINGLDEKKLKEFEDMYLRVPSCDYKKCGCYHCSECPASNYVHNHSITKRFENICELQKIENKIYDKYALNIANLYVPNDVHNNLDFEGLKECLECEEHSTGILSPNYDKVQSW